MAAEAAAPAPVAAATAAPKRGAPSPAPGRRRRLPGEARSGPGRPRAGRSRCGEWEARPGLAGRDPLRRGAGRAFRGGAWAGAGPRRWGEERGSGGRCPPHLCASRGVSRPEMHGRRAQLLDLGPPRGALARRHSHPGHSRGGVQAGAPVSTLPKCSEVAVLPVPRWHYPPGGHLQVLPPGLGRDPRHDCQSTDRPLGSP